MTTRSLVLSVLLAVSGTAPGIGAQPVIRSMTPETIRPFTAVTIHVDGEGFGPGCRALLGRAGRFVPVATKVIDGTSLEVRLPAGLPPAPSERPVVVECGGVRSAAATLRVVPGAGTGEETAEAAPPSDPSGVVPSPAGDRTVPALDALDPPEVPAGEPFTLTITGSGFGEGAAVEIVANVNAGTSRPPEYRPRRFSAERLSDTVLLVDLDRGFAPEPSLRAVQVVNPSGARSAPLFLRITGRKP